MRQTSEPGEIATRPWYLNRKQVIQITGLSRDTIDRLERRDAFPKRIQFSRRKVGWALSEIEAWDRERRKSRPRCDVQQGGRWDDEPTPACAASSQDNAGQTQAAKS